MSPETPGGGGPKTITLGDGTRHVFPNDATDDEINQFLGLGIPKGPSTANQINPTQPPRQLGPDLGNILSSIRPFIAGGAGALGAGAVSAVPVLGEVPGAQLAADTGGYALADYAIKKGAAALGGPSDDTGFEESMKDGVLNAVTGKIINGVFKGIKAVNSAGTPEIYKFAPTSSQALEAYGYHKLATSAKFFEDYGVPAAKAAALDKAGGEGFTQALAFANNLNGRRTATNIDPVKLSDRIKSTLMGGLSADVPESSALRDLAEKTGQVPKLHKASEEALDILNGGQNPFGKLDEVIKDPDKLSKVLKVGSLSGTPQLNVRRDLAAYQFTRMINDATTQSATGVTRIDPSKLAKTWNNKDISTSLDLLYGKQGREAVTDFIKNIAYTQDKIGTYSVARKLTYAVGGFHLASQLLTGNMSGAETTGLTLAGFHLLPATVGKLLVNPATSKLVTKLVAGLPTVETPEYIGKLLSGALQSERIAMVDDKGNKTWGTLEKDPSNQGTKFVPFR